MSDWDPGTYHRFRGLRLRPALDLIRSVPALPDGPVVDLGCGCGVVGPMLRSLGRPVSGVDSSPSMLAEAEALGCYDFLDHADIAHWRAAEPPALLFSNAALHWLGRHDRLIPRLADQLTSGGTMAVQMPNQNAAASHRLWLELAERLFPGRVDLSAIPGILEAPDYYRLLASLGAVNLWETDYWQRLDPSGSEGHPVRLFSEATFARPVFAPLSFDERKELIAAYDAEVVRHYPVEQDGSVLFRFRRLFFTPTV